ncbi:MAG: DMT family transporter [Bdellovibrionales bacterium]|nr:DMT family transporter [Bdellovibrionales bacterium]
MGLYLVIPIVAGICIVLQGGLNRLSAGQFGLLSAVLVNALVFVVFSLGLWIGARNGWLPVPESLGANSIRDLRWWQYLPGLFGFLIVLLIPLSIGHLGAGLTFSLVIATQLVASFAWDSYRHQLWPPLAAWVGLGLILAGSIILIRVSQSAN